MTAEHPYTLQLDATFPLRIAASRGGSGPPCHTWFSGPIRVLNPNGNSIGSAVFAGLTGVTDRPTDHATWSVTIDRIYVRGKLRCGLIITVITTISVYGDVVVTIAIARVQPVYLMKAD